MSAYITLNRDSVQELLSRCSAGIEQSEDMKRFLWSVLTHVLCTRTLLTSTRSQG